MRRLPLLAIAGAMVCGLAAAARAQDATATEPAARPFVVLDTTSSWRMHQTLKGPVVDIEGAPTTVVPVGSTNRAGPFWQQLLGPATEAPAADWTSPDFDDGAWLRAPAARACLTPYLARLCLRGLFNVTDPAKVGRLHLEVGYHGGAVVYVNGTELLRRDVPAGPVTAGTLAAPYPLAAYVDTDGKLIGFRGDVRDGDKVSPEVARRIALRTRVLAVDVPRDALRPGTNVVAVELLRAPYHKVLEEQKVELKAHGKWPVEDFSWNTCQIRHVTLTAASADGLACGAARPAGLQLWNSDPMAVDYPLDMGNTSEPLRPIDLVGARNGAWSGKVVVGSAQPIRGLSATVSDLVAQSGRIAASQVRVRYAMPWGDIALTTKDNNESIPYTAEVEPLAALWDKPPAEVPVYRGEVTRRCLQLPAQAEPQFGAVVGVWVTVKVPADAPSGRYSGTLKVAAEGATPVSVPVRLTVEDWTLPDPRDHKTWIELVQSPDTLAMEYGLEPWSDRHTAMIAHSMDLIAELGSRVVYLPLIAQTNVGNEHSIVRWVKRGDAYEYDFSVMEKYLDLTEKHMGKPEVVVLNVWDRYLIRKDSGGRDFQIEKGLKVALDGPLVTQLDPQTGQLTETMLPPYPDPASEALWAPLFKQLRGRLRRRGLEQAMLLGTTSDFWPTKAQTEFLKKVSGDMPWNSAGHYAYKSMHDIVGYGYQASYFGVQFGFGKSLYGWRTPERRVLFERVGLDYYPPTKWRLIPQQSITGTARGVGRLGADTWAVVKDKRDRRRGRAWERYPASNWGYLNINSSTLAPSPDGPVATLRLEALREGVQECEAQIVIEQALTDEAARQALGPELVAQCTELLDARRAAMWRTFAAWQSGASYSHDLNSWRERGHITGYLWFLGSHWQEQSRRLFALAGRVQRKLSSD